MLPTPRLSVSVERRASRVIGGGALHPGIVMLMPNGLQLQCSLLCDIAWYIFYSRLQSEYTDSLQQLTFASSTKTLPL